MLLMMMMKVMMAGVDGGYNMMSIEVQYCE